MASRTGVVTPEGVLLDYRPAGLATRTVGRLVDLSMQVLIAYVIFTAALAVAIFGIGSGTTFIIFSVFLGFTILFGYPVLFEVYGGGRTPGHRATGTRVIRTDGGPVRFRHAAIRAMLFLVDGLVTTGFAGSVAILSTKRGQRLGDLAAGTMVVRLDSQATWDNRAHAVPSDLQNRVEGFELRRLDQADLNLAQLLIERGPNLFPASQVDLAERIAGRLDDKLGSVMADADRPADFVAAVLAAGTGQTSQPPEPARAVAAPTRDFLNPIHPVASEDPLPAEPDDAEAAPPEGDDRGFAAPT